LKNKNFTRSFEVWITGPWRKKSSQQTLIINTNRSLRTRRGACETAIIHTARPGLRWRSLFYVLRASCGRQPRPDRMNPRAVSRFDYLFVVKISSRLENAKMLIRALCSRIFTLLQRRTRYFAESWRQRRRRTSDHKICHTDTLAIHTVQLA